MKLNCSEYDTKLAKRLKQAVQDGRISHAYIFEGPRNTDKTAFALSFIKALLCPKGKGENCGACSICSKIDHDNYEDLIYIERDGLSVKNEAIERMQEKINVKPLGSRNVVIINDCDTMTLRAQNRLLKTLEEPPGDTLIILLSENMSNLTQTVRSRCVKYRIEGGAQTEASATAEKLADMSLQGCFFYELMNEIGGISTDRTKIEELFDAMESIYRKLITVNQSEIQLFTFDDIYNKIQWIEEARKQIRQGMTPGYALKRFLLRVSK